MRLVRRLTESIRNHDWFFVVVDVLVLVLGLLLAFQVDRWWEQRRDRREEQVFLGHLWDDAELNRTRARSSRAYTSTRSATCGRRSRGSAIRRLCESWKRDRASAAGFSSCPRRASPTPPIRS